MSDEGRDPVSAAMLAMEAAVREDFEAKWPKNPEASMVREVCRGLCRQRDIDPDRVVMGGGYKGYLPNTGPNDTIYIHHPLGPVWASYVQDVRAILALVNHMDLLKWPT